LNSFREKTMANDKPTTKATRDPKLWDKPRKIIVAMVPTYKKPDAPAK
jgi:hypothetical protein